MANPPGSAIVAAHLPHAMQALFTGKDAFQIRHAPRDTILTHENDVADHSILLLEGWIALSKTLVSGDVQITDLMLPGDFALIGTRMVPVASTTISALSDVRYILIGPDSLNGPGAACEALRHMLAACILTTQSRTSELLLRLGRGTAANRIAYGLLEIYTRLEAVGLTTGTAFEFPITQQKFGEFTGLTNVHVCRTLRRFEASGLIRHPDHRTIELVDLPALCDLANIDLDRFRHEILINWPIPA